MLLIQNIGNDRIDIDLNLKVDESFYKSYKQQYIKAPKTPDKQAWEIFADNIY